VANGGRRHGAVLQKVQNGPFINRIVAPGLATLEGHWKDGRDYTLLFAENLQATYYDEIGWNGFNGSVSASIDGLDLKVVHQDYEDRMWSPVVYWWMNGTPINENGATCPVQCLPSRPRRYSASSCPYSCADPKSTWARPSSDHSGGVNVAFGSGRAIYLSENIDYKVYIALMTLNDRASDSPFPNFILEDKDIH
jgi:hypothetical protein